MAAMKNSLLLLALGLTLGLVAACGAVAEPREPVEPLALGGPGEPGQVAVADFAMF